MFRSNISGLRALKQIRTHLHEIHQLQSADSLRLAGRGRVALVKDLQATVLMEKGIENKIHLCLEAHESDTGDVLQSQQSQKSRVVFGPAKSHRDCF